jgi:hypothetical protein
MKLRWLALCLLTFGNVFACESEGVLQGKGMLTFGPFNIKIYQLAYYIGEADKKSLAIHYQKNIMAKFSRMGWEKGLKDNLSEQDYNGAYASAVAWILANTPDVKSKDCLIISKNKNLVTFTHNNAEISRIDDPKVSEIIFSPWLGEKSVDEKLKKYLLGLNNK